MNKNTASTKSGNVLLWALLIIGLLFFVTTIDFSGSSPLVWDSENNASAFGSITNNAVTNGEVQLVPDEVPEQFQTGINYEFVAATEYNDDAFIEALEINRAKWEYYTGY